MKVGVVPSQFFLKMDVFELEWMRGDMAGMGCWAEDDAGGGLGPGEFLLCVLL